MLHRSDGLYFKKSLANFREKVRFFVKTVEAFRMLYELPVRSRPRRNR